jgi:hypothetical protein
MPQIGQVSQSPEYLRGLYRTLGMSEQTIERAIQYRVGSNEPASSDVKRVPGRPRQNVRNMARPAPTASVKRRAAKRKRA